MNQSSSTKKYLALGLMIAVLGFLIGGVFKFTPVFADLSESMRGFTWGGSFSNDAAYQGIGWLSVNNVSDGTGIDYGVHVPSRDGAVSGHGWSEHYGWLSFEAADLSGCSPALAGAARSGTSITGGARFLAIRDEGGNAGGFDGCVSLAGAGYGLNINGSASPYTLSGYAWSSDLGWLDFTGVQIVLEPTGTMSIVGCTIPIGSSHCNVSMTWEIRDAATPNVYNSSLNVGYSLQAVGTNVSQAVTNGTHTIEARNGSTVLQSTVITIGCQGIGVWEPSLGQCVDPRPNLTQPEIRYDLSPGFNSATGVYDYIDITFQTRNDGRSNSGTNANYDMQFDRNGDGVYEAADSVSGTFGPLAPFGYTSPPITRRFNNVIFGNTNIRVAVDTTNTVNEVNESDNVNTVPYTLPPPNPGLSITVDKDRVRHSESTVARWTVQATYPLTCRVYGPNLDVNPARLPSDNRATQPIKAKSIYTLECTETSTNTMFTSIATVDTEAQIEER